MRIRFITAIPFNVLRGSGCYVGIQGLADSIRKLGVEVDFVRPSIHLPVYAVERLWFNQSLRFRNLEKCDVSVGFDLDGYTVAGRSPVPHVAFVKGVIGDAVRFERGTTRMSLALQARWEARHARRADLLMTDSRYCAERLGSLYGIRKPISVVPELIDLPFWRELFRANQPHHDSRKFIVLSVCRFYRRKRIDLLLKAASLLRDKIPGLEIRIVGGGPEARRLHQIWRAENLETVVKWVGDASRSELAREYNRANVFCHPSEQEGFGIVLLEAMAAGKPIVAVRASAVPEVAPHGILVEPGSEYALAEGIEHLYRSPDLRAALGARGSVHVEQFDAPRVGQLFLTEIEKLLSTAPIPPP